MEEKLSLIRSLRDALLEAEQHDRGWNLIDQFTKPLLGEKNLGLVGIVHAPSYQLSPFNSSIPFSSRR